MTVKTFVVGLYETNCYVISDEFSKECVIIDPGYVSDNIDEYIDSNNLTVKHIIFTHGHFDHISGLYHYYTKYKANVLIHGDDADCLTDEFANFTYPAPYEFHPVTPTSLLENDDVVKLGSLNISIIHTPGHTPGGISLYVDGCLFSGDTLFYRSIGRTDFKGGSFEILQDSIRKLYNLPEDTVVYPGHGEKTDIGTEKRQNPFVRAL